MLPRKHLIQYHELSLSELLQDQQSNLLLRVVKLLFYVYNQAGSSGAFYVVCGFVFSSTFQKINHNNTESL